MNGRPPNHESSAPVMDFSEFLRLYPLRAPGLMWFLGAGASAAAGVPTASDLIWDFKRRIYSSRERIPLSSCSDLADPHLRDRLQAFFDADPRFPSEGHAEEYSAYFEVAFPDEGDRRKFLDDALQGASPSFGHLALAALLKLDKARAVWTTNFDTMVEDAVSIIFGTTSALTVADLERHTAARDAIREQRFPMLSKIHGDFRSRRLKNTTTELRNQDSQLRSALVTACKEGGVAVIGYSGRDESVMDALDEAIADGQGFPQGLYWFRRPGEGSATRVVDLIERARGLGIPSAFIEVPTFDEAIGDLLDQIGSLPADIEAALSPAKPRISDAPIREPGSGWPVIRFNAVPLLSVPSTCRRVVCKIGGARDVKDAIKKSGVQAIAARRQVGVIAFGRDAEIRRAFDPFGITHFDLHSIAPHRLGYESAEQGLFYEALAAGLTRALPLLSRRTRRGWVLMCDPDRASDAALQPIRDALKSITGTIPKTNLQWTEGIRIRLEQVRGQLWLVFVPIVWTDPISDGSDEFDRLLSAQRDFQRERSARRYNPQASDLIAQRQLELPIGDN